MEYPSPSYSVAGTSSFCPSTSMAKVVCLSLPVSGADSCGAAEVDAPTGVLADTLEDVPAGAVCPQADIVSARHKAAASIMVLFIQVPPNIDCFI
ncbi:hypothetical protein SDC9_87908 [bioreactor metagenome]|uniref:Uncharacterized protein n=1 Tax=bioreactor metagenome TaxID=1076179 RepID=A0A644ZLN0_9ZZZZ